MYPTAIFDLDGTLLDTLGDLQAAVNHGLASQGLPSRGLAEVRAAVGNGVRRLVERSIPEGTPAPVLEAAFADFRATYATHYAELTHPYPGMVDLVRSLGEQGVALAVVSNKSDDVVRELIDRYYPGLFSFVSGERAGVARKPDPALVRLAVEALHADPANYVYVGDSEVDLATARAAGCPCIACSWGFRGRERLEELGASPIVDAPRELEAAILAG